MKLLTSILLLSMFCPFLSQKTEIGAIITCYKGHLIVQRNSGLQVTWQYRDGDNYSLIILQILTVRKVRVSLECTSTENASLPFYQTDKEQFGKKKI